MDDQALADRCAGGEREAQRQLYAQQWQRVYRVSLGMMRNPEDAFDVAQETFLRVFDRIGQYDGRSTLQTWMYRITVNQALQTLRRDQRRRAKLAELPSLTPDRSHGDSDPDVRLDVAEALARLDPDERAVLLLRYWEGLDYRAIAAALDCAEGTVASRLNRARGALRRSFEADSGAREETCRAGHPTI